jgi:glycosyltransferase involved in cell wall biosynthesis
MNSNPKLPISVCMMAGAEESRIGYALASVAGWVGEIVVVINDSVTDATESIALGFGAKVFREPWKGFIGQSNSALRKCSEAWVLGLDSDEVVSVAMRESIHHFFHTGNAANLPPAAVSFNRRTWFMGQWIRHGDWYPDRQFRLFQRTKAEWAGLEPHHKLVFQEGSAHLSGDILHYSHRSFSDYLGKIQLFTDRFVSASNSKQRGSGGFSISARAVWRFFRAYVLRRGFLDGWIGFYLALSQAFFTAHRHWSLKAARSSPEKDRPPLFGNDTSDSI